MTAGRREVEQTFSSLSDARALQLWDEVAASVRPRGRAIGTAEIRCRPGDVCLMSGYGIADVAAHMPTSEHWAFHGKDLGRARVHQEETMPAFPLAYTRDDGAWE